MKKNVRATLCSLDKMWIASVMLFVGESGDALALHSTWHARMRDSHIERTLVIHELISNAITTVV